MPIKDGFDPAHPLPRFLAVQAEQGTGNALDGVVRTSRGFKVGILIATATAIGIAALAVKDPTALFAEGSASLVDNWSPQSAPTIQAAADAPPAVPPAAVAPASSPTTKDEPSRDEIAASDPAAKDQTENSESASEALFSQFQAWAAEQDAQARVAPAEPVQDASAQVVHNAPAPAAENVRVPHRLVQKRRHVRADRNTRAEMHAPSHRKQIRRAQSERAARPPMQDARAQDQSVQEAQAPSFLPIFGLRN